MKRTLLPFFIIIFYLSNVTAQVNIPNYKDAALLPGTNYYKLVAEVRLKLKLKKEYLASQGKNEENDEGLREEIAQFERWAYDYSFKIGPNGTLPNGASGWFNTRVSHPYLLTNQNPSTMSTATGAATWTSIGPFDSAYSNGWSAGGGIGRINVMRQNPKSKNILFAGSAAGGIFKSTNVGVNWVPITDQFAGLGVSDIVIDNNNPSIMYVATGDFDGKHINSIGVYKTVDGGNNWTATGLTFSLNNPTFIAHLLIDPENSNRIYATTTNEVMRSTDAGATWNSVFDANSSVIFNDIVKVVSGSTKRIFVSSGQGKLYRSENDGDSFTEVFTNSKNGRLDFAFSPAKPDILTLLFESNPAFSRYTISTNTVAPFTNITNSNPSDNGANFNTQQGYNQVIAVSPSNGDSIWVGEFSGKLSTDGGVTWQNKFNGYYDPADATNNWGGFYLHSDHHHFEFVGSDTLLIGNDGGAYVGKISTNDFKQRFNGLIATQSYSIAIYNNEPDNLIIGNQDNDGKSRVGTGANAKFYDAQAGDGTVTAIGRNNSNIRYLGGTNGKLAYRNDGFSTSYSGTSITTPSGAPFVWDMEMHSIDESILYGGFADINKMTGGPTGSWIPLNSGASTNVKSITLADNNATSQKIIIIDDANNVRKSANETTWSIITKPAGVNFNNIYAKKSDWNILLAAAAGYDAPNKVFYSSDNGISWINITKNLPNIVMKKIILYEGSDTVFLATELGIFFSRISVLTSPISLGNEWTKFGGNSFPNVRVEDMEISTTKKQLYAATFGRGVWVIDISSTGVLALNNILFTYSGTNINGQYNLSWDIEMQGISYTTLEKSIDASHYYSVFDFRDNRKNLVNTWPTNLVNDKEYYRLKVIKLDGSIFYSNIIKLSKSQTMLVSVYPNPVSGYLFVNSKNSIASIIIYNNLGIQCAFAKPNNNLYYFNMSHLATGNYFVKVEDKEGNVTIEKIVKFSK